MSRLLVKKLCEVGPWRRFALSVAGLRMTEKAVLSSYFFFLRLLFFFRKLLRLFGKEVRRPLHERLLYLFVEKARLLPDSSSLPLPPPSSAPSSSASESGIVVQNALVRVSASEKPNLHAHL